MKAAAIFSYFKIGCRSADRLRFVTGRKGCRSARASAAWPTKLGPMNSEGIFIEPNMRRYNFQITLNACQIPACGGRGERVEGRGEARRGTKRQKYLAENQLHGWWVLVNHESWRLFDCNRQEEEQQCRSLVCEKMRWLLHLVRRRKRAFSARFQTYI